VGAGGEACRLTEPQGAVPAVPLHGLGDHRSALRMDPKGVYAEAQGAISVGEAARATTLEVATLTRAATLRERPAVRVVERASMAMLVMCTGAAFEWRRFENVGVEPKSTKLHRSVEGGGDREGICLWMVDVYARSVLQGIQRACS
jgi:hypothetical protein